MKLIRRPGLVIVAIVIATNAWSQAPLQIKGKFKPAMEGTISVYKPVSGIFNTALADPKSEVSIQNGSFIIDVSIGKPGFIRLQGKGTPQMYFYAEPGGSMEVSVLKDQAGKMKLAYGGDNSAANNLLATNAPLDNHTFLQYGLPKLFQVTTAAELMTSLKQQLKDETKPFGTMLSKKKITQGCYDAMMRETEQTILHWINIYTKDFKMPERELSQVSKLTPGELNKLAVLLYMEYDPFDNKYRVATRTYDNQMFKSMLIEDGVLPGKSNQTATWAPFADNFTMVVSRLPAIDHAPDSVQMTFMGMSLVTALAYRSMKDEEFLKVFNVYYEKFPGSPFISVITEQLGSHTTAETPVESDAEADIYFLLKKTDSIQAVKSKIVEANSIGELVKNEFAGRPVFVDFWATWCSPCIAEFQHEPSLRKFLKQKNVVTLYVSIDNENAVKKWEKTINKYQLSGYHHLANKEFRTNLDHLFSGIPRYMFFDSKGELKDNGLPKPGSKGELYQRIGELLGQ